MRVPPHKPLADGKSDPPTIVGTAATETRIMTVPLREMDRNYVNGGTVPYKAIFCGDVPLHRPYIGLIYGRYLQFRFLSWPVIMIHFFRSSHSCIH